MSFGRFRDDSSSNKNQSSGSASSEDSRDSSGMYGSMGAGGSRKEAYIGKGSKIVGNLQFSGPIELDGHVDGEVLAQDRLTVGESAIINAKLSGAEVVVKGTVNGDIFATKRIVLKKPARVVGSLSTPLLSIEEGVVFEGKIAMIAAEKKSQEASSTEGKIAQDSNVSLSKSLDSKAGGPKSGLAAVS